MNFESGFVGDSQETDDSGLKRRRRIILIVAGVALLGALLLWRLVGPSQPTAADPVDLEPRVTVVRPGRNTVSAAVDANGTVAARREMPVGVVGEGGQVKAVLVEAGSWVKAGQVLARVERSVQIEQRDSLEAQLQVAHADARLAQNDLDRAQSLVSRGFISKADLDRKTATRDAAVAKVRVAEAQLAEQTARIGRLDIRAPAAGLVLTREVEPGQVIGAGSGTLFRMAKGGEMELLAKVGESDLARLSVGDRATVTPMGSTKSYEGRIWQLSSVIDPQSRQGLARILVPYHKDLRPGGFAAAHIISGSMQASVLPESAIQNDDESSFVYVVNDQNVIERRNVKIGQVSAAGVTILSGLQGDEKVVTLAGGFLTPGQKVHPELRADKKSTKADN